LMTRPCRTAVAGGLGSVAGRVDRRVLLGGRPDEGPLFRGLDGAFWIIEGRRKDVFSAASRSSPGGTFHDLGKLFFELAGPPLAEVGIY
jgi:hypothetical protein